MDIRAIEARSAGDYVVTLHDADTSTTVLLTAEGRLQGAPMPGVDPAPLGEAVRALHRARTMAGAW